MTSKLLLSTQAKLENYLQWRNGYVDGNHTRLYDRIENGKQRMLNDSGVSSAVHITCHLIVITMTATMNTS